MFYRQGTWTRNIYTQMIGMADEGVSYAGWTELNEYTKFIFTDYNFSEVNTKIWREHYTAIFRANQVLDNIVNVPFSDETHKDDLIGQTKFLRAFYYFYLSALLTASSKSSSIWVKISSAVACIGLSEAEEVFSTRGILSHKAVR